MPNVPTSPLNYGDNTANPGDITAAIKERWKQVVSIDELIANNGVYALLSDIFQVMNEKKNNGTAVPSIQQVMREILPQPTFDDVTIVLLKNTLFYKDNNIIQTHNALKQLAVAFKATKKYKKNKQYPENFEHILKELIYFSHDPFSTLNQALFDVFQQCKDTINTRSIFDYYINTINTRCANSKQSNLQHMSHKEQIPRIINGNINDHPLEEYFTPMFTNRAESNFFLHSNISMIDQSSGKCECRKAGQANMISQNKMLLTKFSEYLSQQSLEDIIGSYGFFSQPDKLELKYAAAQALAHINLLAVNFRAKKNQINNGADDNASKANKIKEQEVSLKEKIKHILSNFTENNSVNGEEVAIMLDIDDDTTFNTIRDKGILLKFSDFYVNAPNKALLNITDTAALTPDKFKISVTNGTNQSQIQLGVKDYNPVNVVNGIPQFDQTNPVVNIDQTYQIADQETLSLIIKHDQFKTINVKKKINNFEVSDFCSNSMLSQTHFKIYNAPAAEKEIQDLVFGHQNFQQIKSQETMEAITKLTKAKSIEFKYIQDMYLMQINYLNDNNISDQNFEQTDSSSALECVKRFSMLINTAPTTIAVTNPAIAINELQKRANQAIMDILKDPGNGKSALIVKGLVGFEYKKGHNIRTTTNGININDYSFLQNFIDYVQQQHNNNSISEQQYSNIISNLSSCAGIISYPVLKLLMDKGMITPERTVKETVRLFQEDDSQNFFDAHNAALSAEAIKKSFLSDVFTKAIPEIPKETDFDKNLSLFKRYALKKGYLEDKDIKTKLCVRENTIKNIIFAKTISECIDIIDIDKIYNDKSNSDENLYEKKMLNHAYDYINKYGLIDGLKFNGISFNETRLKQMCNKLTQTVNKKIIDLTNKISALQEQQQNNGALAKLLSKVRDFTGKMNIKLLKPHYKSIPQNKKDPNKYIELTLADLKKDFVQLINMYNKCVKCFNKHQKNNSNGSVYTLNDYKTDLIKELDRNMADANYKLNQFHKIRKIDENNDLNEQFDDIMKNIAKKHEQLKQYINDFKSKENLPLFNETVNKFYSGIKKQISDLTHDVDEQLEYNKNEEKVLRNNAKFEANLENSDVINEVDRSVNQQKEKIVNKDKTFIRNMQQNIATKDIEPKKKSFAFDPMQITLTLSGTALPVAIVVACLLAPISSLFALVAVPFAVTGLPTAIIRSNKHNREIDSLNASSEMAIYNEKFEKTPIITKPRDKEQQQNTQTDQDQNNKPISKDVKVNLHDQRSQKQGQYNLNNGYF